MTTKTRNSSKIPLTDEQLEAFGAELDAIRKGILDDLGDADATYIRKVVKIQKTLEVAGRVGFYLPPLWPLAVASLGIAKIIDNMEIGHNVMHGQYDWMGDAGLNSRTFEWDTMAPAINWQHGHNYIHHTYTNIVGKDRDLGYGILRIDESQEWNPYYLFANIPNALALMFLFEGAVALHDLEIEEVVAGRRTFAENKELLQRIWKKSRKQLFKDYVMYPALTGPLFPLTALGNLSANVIRNIWAFNIIFCGHFPAGVATFSLEETENESRGQWYYRQLLGSANITGGKLMHLMSGNLSHQIEHHLFPDIPARRYPEAAVQVREVCEKYGLQYNTGPFFKQIGSVWLKIARLSLPTKRTGVEAAAPSPESETVAA